MRTAKKGIKRSRINSNRTLKRMKRYFGSSISFKSSRLTCLRNFKKVMVGTIESNPTTMNKENFKNKNAI